MLPLEGAVGNLSESRKRREYQVLKELLVL